MGLLLLLNLLIMMMKAFLELITLGSGLLEEFIPPVMTKPRGFLLKSTLELF